MERKVLAPFLNVLINWHLRLSGAVRWGGALSHMIKFMSGTRQEGILSGLCFNIYVSPLINKLRDSGSGCRLINAFLGYIVCADDILLLSASFSKLQEMLNSLLVMHLVWNGMSHLIHRNLI